MKLDKSIAILIGAIIGAVLIILIGAVGFLYYHDIAQTSPAISREESAISSLNGQVANLQSQLATVNSQVSILQTQLSSANSDITTLQNQLSSANSDITTLQAQLASLQAQVSNQSQYPIGIWWYPIILPHSP
jgi:peptidoglycan hydrolase CwlO-like protein